MGNLVREALQLGFQVFGYEKTDRKKERDLEQAKNIERYMAAHPKEKVLIHCGWYHAIESDFPKRKRDNYMAYHLKNRLGIDPFTIYQDALSERGVGEESPYYKAVDANEVSVLLDNKGRAFNGVSDKSHFDVLLYHPPTKYIKNRPHWLLESGTSKFVSVDKNQILEGKYPVIVEAFPTNEKYSVPVDVIELKDESDVSELVLKNGSYLIRLTNTEGAVVEYLTEIE